MRFPIRPFDRLATCAVHLAAAAFVLGATTTAAEAQRRARRPEELRGSQESVQKMHDFAQLHRLPFYLTPTNINQAVARGRLVPLTGDATYALTRGVGSPYATREARQFVLDLAPQYLAACGTPLTVTSAARPTSRQPRNSNPYSVHPTGIAVDIRRPPAGPCQSWLRNALAELEAKGFIEATEERHPVHMHIAVLTAPGTIAALPKLGAGTVASRPTAPVAPSTTITPVTDDDTIRSRTYRVRSGDTLWDVARRSGVTVQALARENRRSARAVLRPGTTLRLPAS